MCPVGCCLLGGWGERSCCLLEGLLCCLLGGGGVPPIVNRMTDRCRNITLSQTSFAAGKKSKVQCA